MRVRAISHQIVIAIQSTFDGSTARHPHDTVDLLFSCCVMTQHQTFPCIHSRTFTGPTTGTLASGQNPDFIRHRNATISHPLLHLQLLSCPYGQLFSRVCSASILIQLCFLQILNCRCHCRLLTARCSHFFPHWKNIPKIFRSNLVH